LVQNSMNYFMDGPLYKCWRCPFGPSFYDVVASDWSPASPTVLPKHVILKYADDTVDAFLPRTGKGLPIICINNTKYHLLCVDLY